MTAALKLKRHNGTPHDSRALSRLMGLNLARPSTQEMGYGGVAHFGGYYTDEEWNAKLRGVEGVKRRRQMFYRHPILHAGFQAITLPLCSVGYEVTAFSNAPRDREIAEAVQRQLENIRHGWDDFCDEAWDVLVYGYYPFEKVWRMDKGAVVLDALASRPPTSIERLVPDERGELASIEQYVYSDGRMSAPTYIPREKLLFLVRKRRGNNWHGIGLGDACHMFWSILMELYMMHSIAIEKRNMGVDSASLDEGDPNSDETRKLMNLTLTALRGLHNREQQGIVLPPGVKYALQGIQGSVIDALPYIDALEKGCLRSMLAEFIAMGGEGGSYAMHRDKSSFFTASLKAHARVLTGAMTEQVVAPIVAYNYPDVPREEYPWLDHGPLDTRDTKALGEVVAAFVQSGTIPPDKTTREFADSLLGIVDRPEPEDVTPPPDAPPEDDAPDPPETTPDGDEQVEDGNTTNAALFVRAFAKGLRSARHPVVRHVNFAGMNEAMDKGAERIVEALHDVQKRQVAALVRHAKRNFGGPLRKLTSPKVPLQKEAAASIAEILRELFERGRAEVTKEMQLQGMASVALAEDEPDPDDPEASEEFLEEKARLLSSLGAGLLLSTYGLEIAGMKRQGTLDAARLAEALNGLALQSAKKAANETVSEALALGRQTEQQRLEDSGAVDQVIYSAIGDGETCGPCGAADGAEFPSLSAMMEANAYPPLRGSEFGTCEGTGSCRCDAITVLAAGA